MNGAQIVELALIILAFGCVCEMTKAILDRADEKLRRIFAEEKSITYLRRALDAEAVIRRAAYDYDRHTDQALEVAEPTPDLRRVR